MATKYLLLLCLLVPLALAAQPDPQVDSLQQALARHQAAHNRLATAETLLAIGTYYYTHQEDQKALEFVEQGLQQAPPDQPVLRGRLLYRRGMLVYFIQQDIPKALVSLDSANVLLQTTSDPTILTPFFQSYGSLLNQQQRSEEGRTMLLKAEQLCLAHPDPGNTDRLLNIYSNLLSGAYAQADYEAALTFARKGIEVGKNSQNYELIGDLYYNNGLTLSALGYEADAEKNYLKSLEVSQKGGVLTGIVTATIALGDYYGRNGQFDRGLRYLADAKAAARQAQNFYSVATVQKMEAVTYAEQRRFPEALASLDSCLQYCEQTRDPRLLPGLFFEKARILRLAGQLDAAVEAAQREVENARGYHSWDWLNNTFRLLSEIEKERGNFEQALAYHEQYVAYKDSVYQGNLEQKVAEERTRQHVEAEQDARRKAELEASLLSSRNQLYGTVAGGLLLILLLGGYLYWQLQKTRKQLETRNGQLTTLNATKDKFFGIIAHDLRNPLSAFQGVGEQLDFFLKKGDTAKLHTISALLSKSAANLSALLDNLLSWALLNRGLIPYHPQRLSLADEVNANFDLHQHLAAAKQIQLTSDVAPDLYVDADANGLQTILRNLVGNALKFTPIGGQVRVSATRTDGWVKVAVSDTGAGLSAEQQARLFDLDRRSEHGTAGEKGAGLGLVICQELVQMHGSQLQVRSVAGAGATFEFALPEPID